jgi:hypothetical protein|nr:MAG TPA: hypothetical protein [Caudoviricetes sp.]
MKMREQRLLGALLVVVSGIMLAIALSGTTVEERDATAVFLTLPLGLYMMFSSKYLLNDGYVDEDAYMEAEWSPANNDTPQY